MRETNERKDRFQDVGQVSEEERERILDRLRNWFSHVPPDVSLANELIRERRAEAARENPTIKAHDDQDAT